MVHEIQTKHQLPGTSRVLATSVLQIRTTQNSKEMNNQNTTIVFKLIGRRITLHEQLALGDDRRNHARLQLLARQVVVLQVAGFVTEGLAVFKHAGKHVRHVGLRLHRVARIIHAVAALVARLQPIGLHDLAGIVRQILAVLRIGLYAGLFLNALVDDGAGLPVGVIAPVGHDWRVIEMDVVGSSVACGPAHFLVG